MLIVICVKFHDDRTSASLKTNLTKNFNLSGTDERTNGRTDGLTDRKTICPSYFVCRGIKMVVRIPLTKVTEIIEKIRLVKLKEKVTLRTMQSLIGILQFACRAIVPGRPFCRRLINSTCGLTCPHHHLRITKSMKQDLNMWLTFFQDFNGVSVFHDRFWTTSSDVELFSDSAASCGFGLYFAGKWAYAALPEDWRESGLTNNISVLEFFPILVALYIWGEHLRNKKVLFHSDNVAVVQAINSATSKSDQLMTLLRAFTLKCLKLNIACKAEHIPGVRNVITDSLSRF